MSGGAASGLPLLIAARGALHQARIHIVATPHKGPAQEIAEEGEIDPEKATPARNGGGHDAVFSRTGLVTSAATR